MAEKADDDPEAARARLLELFEAEEWEFSDRAEQEGRLALRWVHNRVPSRWEMVEYVMALLRTSVELRRAPQGDPPGATGIAWQMTDSRNIFVKLRICERRFGEECAYIQSLHESVHH